MDNIHRFYFKPPLADNYWGHIFSEVYKDLIYTPFLPQKKENTTCLEVGGNVGIVSYYFSQYFEKVIVLEPAIEHYDLLIRMLKDNNITNVKAIPKALYLENTKLPFFHNKNKTMYSLHMGVDDKSSPPEEVETITFDKLFKDENIEHVDLLKADVEGTEFELFASEGFRKVASKIDTIVTEKHSWSGRNSNQLDEAFKNNGFRVSKIASSADIVVAQRIK